MKHLYLIIMSSLLCYSIHSYPLYRSKKNSKPSLSVLMSVSTFPLNSTAAISNQINGLLDEGCEVFIHANKVGDPQWVDSLVQKHHLMQRIITHPISVNNMRYDILCAQFGTRALKWLPLKKVMGNRFKLAVCFRGYDLSGFVQKHGNIYRELFQYADVILPVCETFKKRLIELGCDATKIIVQPSAIDTELFSYKKCSWKPGEPLHLLSICRLVEKKGLEYSIRAVAQLVEKYPHISYTIIGFGPLQEDLQQLIAELKMEKYIKIEGRKTPQEVAVYLKKSHIFILPCVTSSMGDMEGIPNVLKEAMAVGLPVISTYHSGIPELVKHEKVGLLVAEKNVTALMEAIEKLMTLHEKWPQMGWEGRKIILNKYSTKALGKRLKNIFMNLMK